MILTVKQIDAARFGLQKERMSDGAGLYLRLYPSGKRAFQVQVLKESGGTGRVWVSLPVRRWHDLDDAGGTDEARA